MAERQASNEALACVGGREWLAQENQRLREELSAATVLIARQNLELEGLRKHADCLFPQSPTSVVDDDSSTTVVHIEGRTIPLVDDIPPSKVLYFLSQKNSGRSTSSITIPDGMSTPFAHEYDGEETNNVITATVVLAKRTDLVSNSVVGRSTPLLATREPAHQCDKNEKNDRVNAICSRQIPLFKLTEEHRDCNEIPCRFRINDDLNRSSDAEASSAASRRKKDKMTAIATPLTTNARCQNGRIDSEATTKASNTTASTIDDDALIQHGRHLHFLTYQHPLPFSRKPRRDTPLLVPPKRILSPLPRIKTTALVPRSTMTLEVEKESLRDASDQEGIYTGSIDPHTLLPDGFGTMNFYKGEKYTGDWEQGLYHGSGKHQNLMGDIYDGPFEHGLKQGDCATMNFCDGRSFCGRFHADMMREGILHFVDGSRYEGLLKNNKRDGFGLYVFENGDQYEGQWKDDLMHGRGRMEWKSDAAWYNGDWESGVMHGFGTEVDSQGNIVHQGYFLDGEPVVQAELIYDSGDDDENDDGCGDE